MTRTPAVEPCGGRGTREQREGRLHAEATDGRGEEEDDRERENEERERLKMYLTISDKHSVNNPKV
jgi:hypothetical protein